MLWGLIDRYLLWIYLRSAAIPTPYLIPPKMSLKDHFRLNISKGFLKTYYRKLRNNPNLFWRGEKGVNFLKGITYAIIAAIWIISFALISIVTAFFVQTSIVILNTGLYWGSIFTALSTVFLLFASYRKIHLNKVFETADCYETAKMTKWGSIRHLSEKMNYLSPLDRRRLSKKFNNLLYSTILLATEPNESLNKAVNLKIDIINSEIENFIAIYNAKKEEKERRIEEKKLKKSNRKISVKDFKWDSKKTIQELMEDPTDNTVGIIEQMSEESLQNIYGIKG